MTTPAWQGQHRHEPLTTIAIAPDCRRSLHDIHRAASDLADRTTDADGHCRICRARRGTGRDGPDTGKLPATIGVRLHGDLDFSAGKTGIQPPLCLNLDVHYVAARDPVDPLAGDAPLSVGEQIAPVLRQFDLIYSVTHGYPALRAILDRNISRASSPYFVTISDQPAEFLAETCPDCSTGGSCSQSGAHCQWNHSDCVVCAGPLPRADQAIKNTVPRPRLDFRIVICGPPW